MSFELRKSLTTKTLTPVAPPKAAPKVQVPLAEIARCFEYPEERLQKYHLDDGTTSTQRLLKERLNALFFKTQELAEQYEKELVKIIKESITTQFHDGANNCTPGFINRLEDTLLTLEIPRTMDEFIAAFRRSLISKTQILSGDGEVHANSRFTRLANQMGLNIPSFNYDDPHSGRLSDGEIQGTILSVFDYYFRPGYLLNHLFRPTAGLLGSNTLFNGCYPSSFIKAFNERMASAFDEKIDDYDLRFFITEQDEDEEEVDEDETSAIIGLNWTAITRKAQDYLFSHDYINPPAIDSTRDCSLIIDEAHIEDSFIFLKGHAEQPDQSFFLDNAQLFLSELNETQLKTLYTEIDTQSEEIKLAIYGELILKHYPLPSLADTPVSRNQLLDAARNLVSSRETFQERMNDLPPIQQQDVFELLLSDLPPEKALVYLIKYSDLVTPLMDQAREIDYNRQATDIIQKVSQQVTPEERVAALAEPQGNLGTVLLIAARYQPKAITHLFQGLSPEQHMTLLPQKTNKGVTTLHWVCRSQPEAIPHLFDALSTEQQLTLLEQKEDDGWTPLHIACQDQPKAIPHLFERLSTEQQLTLLEQKDNEGWTPLHVACQHKPEAIPHLFERLSTEQCLTLLNQKINEGATPLHIACQHQPTAIPHLFERLSTEQQLTLLEQKDNREQTPLHVACQHKPEAIPHLFERLSTEQRLILLNQKTNGEWTPLHLACVFQPTVIPLLFQELSTEQRLILLKQKKNKGWTPLHIACQEQPEAIPLLFQELSTEQRLTLLEQKNNQGLTPLMVACECQPTAIPLLFQELSTEQRLTLLEQKDNNGWTPLHWACQHQPEAIPLLFQELSTEQRLTLLKQKANFGWTPLHVACQHKPEAIPHLFERLSTEQRLILLNQKTNGEWTPLHVACVFQPAAIPHLLDESSTEQRLTLLVQKNNQGWTPLHIACQERPEAIPHLLQELSTGQPLTLLKQKNNRGLTPLMVACECQPEAMPGLLQALTPEELTQLTPTHAKAALSAKDKSAIFCQAAIDVINSRENATADDLLHDIKTLIHISKQLIMPNAIKDHAFESLFKVLLKSRLSFNDLDRKDQDYLLGCKSHLKKAHLKLNDRSDTLINEYPSSTLQGVMSKHTNIFGERSGKPTASDSFFEEQMRRLSP